MSTLRSGWLLRIAWTLPFGLGLAAVVPAALPGQDTTATAPTVPSATMARVLAEAADQYRTGRPIYLVADYRFPHSVAGPFTSAAVARRDQADSGATFGVFGPFLTRPDPPSDSTPRLVSVTIVVETPGGRETIAVDPKVDALFFTMPAVDKFMIPYYARVYGTEYASILRDRAMLRRPVCHLGSKSCWPKPMGTVLIPIWDPARGPLHAGPELPR